MFGMSRFLVMIVAAAMIVLSGCQSDTEPKAKPSGAATGVAPSELPPSLASLTPYPEPKQAAELEAPAGFEPVFAQNIARHGARSLTSGDPIEDAIGLWEEAKAAGELTSAGKRFGPDARALRLAMSRVGFGELNTLGAEEMEGIGTREGERLAGMFEAAQDEGARVEILDSGVARAEDSATNFSAGLGSVHPDIEIETPESNEKLLKFSGEDDKYEDFLEDGPWKAAYNEVRRLSKIKEAATETLEHLYTPEFVAGIGNKQLEEASAVFDVYRSGPAMSRDINVDTERHMPREAAEAFAYVEDGRYFYSRGPGLEGDDGSYRAAQILLDDFFSVIDDRLEGRGPHPHAAVYRFAHAEELAPFAALIRIPGADKQGKPGVPYTHENSDFRISTVTPLSGNIGWVVWEKGDTHIVSVSHNEAPTTVGRDCTTYEDTENFYQLEELRSCLGAEQ
jgi:hypothetical protein